MTRLLGRKNPGPIVLPNSPDLTIFGEEDRHHIQRFQDLAKDLRILFVSFRLKGLDGVTLETLQWMKAFEACGARTTLFSGETFIPDLLRDGMAYDDLRLLERQYPRFTEGPAAELTNDILGRGHILDSESGRLNAMVNVMRGDLIEIIEGLGINCIVPENALSFPGNLPFGKALVDATNRCDLFALPHHHDCWWERRRFHVEKGSNLEE